MSLQSLTVGFVFFSAAFYAVIVKLTKNGTALRYVQTPKKKPDDMNLSVSIAIWVSLSPHFPLSSETGLREMFVISHQAHGASSKPVCELKCSSINFSTAHFLVKKMLR